MTVFGWDMSHYDAPGIGSAVAEGIQFVTHKAGGDANDAELSAWWSGVKGQRSKLLLGAYWVLYPGNPAGRADAFLARLDALCAGWRDGPFILQVDCEKWGGNASTVPSVSEINDFCARLVSKTSGKYRPIVYAPEWVYGSKVSALRYPLWASSYVSGSGGFKSLYPGDSSSRWGSYGGKSPAILQYTSSATIGGQTTCDANAFRGTIDQLRALTSPGWSDDMEAKDVWQTDIIPNPRQRPDSPTNKTTTAFFAMGDVWARVYDLRDTVNTMNKALTAALAAVASKDAVDEAKLAQELAPAVAAALLPMLPSGVEVTEEALANAFRSILTKDTPDA